MAPMRRGFGSVAAVAIKGGGSLCGRAILGSARLPMAAS